jgi:D-tyrosyl-tRNA(Tyr) deacylase
MKALLQRVAKSSVTVEGKVVGRIAQGLVVLLGVADGDCEKDAEYLADKIVNLRIFSDEQSKFNLSTLNVNGELLVISQFTLLADTRKGRRPSFSTAAPPEKAETLYNYFVMRLKQTGLKVETGEFGAHMMVEIANDGPVTIMLDSAEKASL